MNIQDPNQILSITNLFASQYSDLLPAFEKVLAVLQQGSRTEVSLNELKQLARQQTEPYKTELQNAVIASEQEILVSDLVPDEIGE